MPTSYIKPRYEVTIERDVPYAKVLGYWSHAPLKDFWDLRRRMSKLQLDTLSLEMDIYYPADDIGFTGTPSTPSDLSTTPVMPGGSAPSTTESLRPLLLMMHGGSFLIGHKEEAGQAAWCEYFASLGYVAASINYRLGFQIDKKDVAQAELRALEDADAALAFLLTQREDLRINRERVFVAGTSAGAITALNLAFQLYGHKPAPATTPGGAIHPRLGPDFRIRAVANLWGAVHDLSVLENARVPLLSFQSVKDPAVPYDAGYPIRPLALFSRMLSAKMYGTHAIHQKAMAIGLRSEHHPCPEARHRLHLDDQLQFTPRFYEIQEAMAVFFASEMD